MDRLAEYRRRYVVWKCSPTRCSVIRGWVVSSKRGGVEPFIVDTSLGAGLITGILAQHIVCCELRPGQPISPWDCSLPGTTQRALWSVRTGVPSSLVIGKPSIFSRVLPPSDDFLGPRHFPLA